MLKVEKYFEAFIIISLIFLFLLMIKDYLLSILFASSIVFLIYKPYKWIVKKTKNEFVSSFFTTLLILLFLFFIFYFVGVAILSESSNLIRTGNQLISGFSLDKCNFSFCNQLEKNIYLIGGSFEEIILKIATFLVNSIGSIFSSIANIALNFVVFILALFFFLKDGEKFMKYVKRIVPMKNEYKEALFFRFKQVSSTVFIDSILVAIMQGILVGIGLYFTGFSSPVFWATISAFLSLLPLLGSAIVWVPASIYLFLTYEFVLGIGLFLYGFLIISTSDNLLRPILMHNKVQVHSFLIFLSILGGLAFFGFLGIFLGPIIISLLVSVLQLYKLDFN